jgi:hypothetical protein
MLPIMKSLNYYQVEVRISARVYSFWLWVEANLLS